MVPGLVVPLLHSEPLVAGQLVSRNLLVNQLGSPAVQPEPGLVVHSQASS